MLRLNLGLRPGVAAVLALLVGVSTTSIGSAAHAAGKAPALLVLPIATDPTIPASTAASLRSAIEAQLKSSGVRPVSAARGAPTELGSVDGIRAAAATAGADGVLTTRLERVASSGAVRLELEIEDGSSGAAVWRSGLEQPDIQGLRAFLPEILREAAVAAKDLGGEGRAISTPTTAAAVPEPAPAPEPAHSAPAATGAVAGGAAIGGAAAGGAVGGAVASSSGSSPATPTIHVEPDVPEPVVLNTAPRIEPPLALAAAAAPQMPPSTGFTVDQALRDFDICRFGTTAPIAFVVIDDDSARVLVGEGTTLPTSTARIEARTLETFVAADCADVDGDGIDEIGITGRRNGGFRSRIFKVEEGGRQPVAIGDELPFAIRAASVGARARAFFAQDFPITGRLYGPIRAVEVRGAQVLLGRELDLPGDANVGGLALGIPGPGGSEATLTIDGDAHLRLVASGRTAWTSPGHYGGYDVSFEVAERLQSTTGSLPRVYLRDRIEVVERGTSPLIVLTQIESPLGNVLPNLNVGRDVTVAALRWSGQAFAPIPLPFGMGPEAIGKGTLRDLRIADVTGDRVPDLVVGVVDSEGGTLSFSKAASRILIFPGTASTPLTEAPRSAQ